jgi:hypothetical protein
MVRYRKCGKHSIYTEPCSNGVCLFNLYQLAARCY